MSTRVTSAASKRAKAALISLLFPRQQSKRYSHTQLRTAYLQKVHLMHPDKQRSTSSTTYDTKTAHDKFIQLQNAWEAYNTSAQMFHNNKTNGDNNSHNDNESNFTMFGVGCSFSDSPQERSLREEFMDQACTGFLPDAILQSNDDGDVPQREACAHHQLCTNLSDDEMFMEEVKSESDYNNNFDKCHGSAAKKNLVQNVENYTRRRRRTKGK